MSQDINLVKELRNKTGAGFLDCKNALSDSNNDLEKAIEYLRKKGLAKASKKSSREAKEGAVGIYTNDSKTVVLKINSETDFAAKSDSFLDFIDQLGELALKTNKTDLDKENFLNLQFNEVKVSEYINNMIAKIGENLILNEIIIINHTDTYSSFYVHNSYRKNIGKIISVVEYNASQHNDKVKDLSKNICMHIAAMKPESIDVDDLDKSIIENEKNIQKELILNSGKPSNIVDKILDGKMKKFYSEITLLNQPYILDNEKTISDLLKDNDDYSFVIKSFKLISLT